MSVCFSSQGARGALCQISLVSKWSGEHFVRVYLVSTCSVEHFVKVFCLKVLGGHYVMVFLARNSLLQQSQPSDRRRSLSDVRHMFVICWSDVCEQSGCPTSLTMLSAMNPSPALTTKHEAVSDPNHQARIHRSRRSTRAALSIAPARPARPVYPS